MKRCMSLAIISVLLLGAGFAVYHFSGARGKVAKKELLDKIDNILGKTKVERQEIADGIEGLDKAITRVTRARTTAQVRAETLDEQLTAINLKIQDLEGQAPRIAAELKKVQEDKTYVANIGDGKEYTQKNIKALNDKADQVTENHDALEKNVAELNKRLNMNKTMATDLLKQEKDAKKKLGNMKDRLNTLDDRLEFLAVQKEAAEALSEADKTFAGAIENLDKKLSKLEEKTEVDFRIGKEKWTELAAPTTSVDDSKLVDDTNERIRKLEAISKKK